MSPIKRIDFKQPSETITDPLNFNDRLASGESLSWDSTTVTVIRGTDGSPSSLVKATLRSAGYVKVTLQGGLDGVLYNVKVLASTSGAQSGAHVLEDDLVVPVAEIGG